ncbi:MAG: hypothetical protein DCC59_01855 [Chloroflexi bacterium]|nr:MAG: hypothetical protein DCC59_01855 [Chloroflexota bacterium]
MGRRTIVAEGVGLGVFVLVGVSAGVGVTLGVALGSGVFVTGSKSGMEHEDRNNVRVEIAQTSRIIVFIPL